MSARIHKEEYYNRLKITSTSKIPIFNSLVQIGDEPGMEGDIVLDRSGPTFWGHSGQTWIRLGGVGAVETLAETLLIGNETIGTAINVTDSANVSAGELREANVQGVGLTVPILRLDATDNIGDAVASGSVFINSGNSNTNRSLVNPTSGIAGSIVLTAGAATGAGLDAITPSRGGDIQILAGTASNNANTFNKGGDVTIAGGSGLNSQAGHTRIAIPLSGDPTVTGEVTIEASTFGLQSGGAHLVAKQQTLPVTTGSILPRSTDMAGGVGLNLGAGPGAINPISVTFHRPYATRPFVVVSIVYLDGVPLVEAYVWITSISTTGFSVAGFATEAGNYEIHWMVVGNQAH